MCRNKIEQIEFTGSGRFRQLFNIGTALEMYMCMYVIAFLALIITAPAAYAATQKDRVD